MAQFAQTSLQVPNHSTQFSLHHTPLSALDSDFPSLHSDVNYTLSCCQNITHNVQLLHTLLISNHTSINPQHTLLSKHYTQCSVLNTLLTYNLKASTYNTQLVKSLNIHVWWAICPDPLMIPQWIEDLIDLSSGTMWAFILYLITFHHSILLPWILSRSSFHVVGRWYMNGTHKARSHCSRPWRRLVVMWVACRGFMVQLKELQLGQGEHYLWCGWGPLGAWGMMLTVNYSIVWDSFLGVWASLSRSVYITVM